LRGGSGLSRHALAAGYAAHVRESGLDRLRALCDAGPGEADPSLTLDFAAYLIGAGATPLLDPATPGSQPSATGSIGSPVFYVEVRQVQSVYPAAVVRRAYHRLWGTWRRFRKLQRCDEAFLVVFCRRGRRVELPIEIDLAGLTIYSTSIDLCDPADHPDRSTAIRFSGAKLHL
jgi:hypothetical protein